MRTAETYLISFSIDINDNLFKQYKAVVETLKELGKDDSLQEFSKTTYLLSSTLNRDRIRDSLTNAIRKNGSDGRVLVMDVKLSGWAGHFHDSDGEMVRWLKKYVSMD